MIDVSIIFVNYRNSKMTIDAVNSVIEHSDGFSYEIIIVDNSEDVNEIDTLKKSLKDKALVIDSKSNLGFGKANNLGVAHSKGKYVYFLNNDTLLMNNAIIELYKAMESNSDIGVVGSNLYTKDEFPNHSFIPFEKNYHSDKKMISLWYIALSKLHHKRIDYNYSSTPKKLKGYVCGASLFMRKDTFDKLGGFDKDIFMYAEESLLCYRVRHELNLDIYNIPSSKIIHFEGVKVDNGLSDKRAEAFVEGNSIYYLKAFGKDKCIKYLKMMCRKYKTMNTIKNIIKKGNKDSFVYEKAYRKKLLEMTSD